MKSRFCPSPTGYMHIGNIRTALFNSLYALGSQGVFLLRIEDTDKSRSSEEFSIALMEDMRWLGLNWQEGPEVGGSEVSYYQSERQAIYNRYYKQLEQAKLVYPCFCSDAHLKLTRKLQQAAGQPPRYPGTCRNLTPQEIAEKEEQGIRPTLRFIVPQNHVIEFNDLVKGMQRFQSNDIGDYIIRRADGSASFIFSNAIDDSLMGVTHAMRGDDHLTNTPRQLLILQALNLTAPTYGHVALILGTDGSPLSKRNGSRSVRELREEGYLAIALNNYLARLGHYYESPEFMGFDQLAKNFSTDNLGKTPAHYDASQLLHWQKEAIARCDAEFLWQWFGEKVQYIANHQKENFINTVRHNVVFPKDALHWAEIFFANSVQYSTEAHDVLKQTAPQFFETALTAVENHGTDFKAVSQFVSQQLNIKGKGLFQPLRVAMSGRLDGPEMPAIFNLLGVDGVKQRLKQAAEYK